MNKKVLNIHYREYFDNSNESVLSQISLCSTSNATCIMMNHEKVENEFGPILMFKNFSHVLEKKSVQHV